MSEHEYITQADSQGKTNERPPLVPSPSAEAQPLILYDLATIVGAVYQQRITLTRQGRVTKRFANLLRPLLHGSSWNDERQEDTYINMLCEAAKQLKLIYRSSSYEDDENIPYYCPSLESGLERWTQLNDHEQARQFLTWWDRSMQWHDAWSSDFRQWDASDWNPLAARGLLIDLLSSGIYVPEKWYPVPALLDMIWLRGPNSLRPARYRERSRTQSVPLGLREHWDRCEGIVFWGILSSTLSELGIVSVDWHSTATTTDTSSRLSRIKLTEFGAQVLSKKQISSAPGLGFPSLARNGMSTNNPKRSFSSSEKSIASSEKVPKSIASSEKVFDGFLDEKGLFW